MTSMGGSMGMNNGTLLSGAGKSGNKIPSGYKFGQLQNFTPEMMQLFKQLIGQLGPDSYTSKLASGDESAYAETEAPAMRQFQQLLGQNASRFSGMGMGSRRGSGFQNSTNQATQDFAGQLQANRMNMRNQAIQSLQGYGSSLLGQKPYENYLVEKPQSPWPAIAGQALGSAAHVAGAYLGK